MGEFGGVVEVGWSLLGFWVPHVLLGELFNYKVNLCNGYKNLQIIFHLAYCILDFKEVIRFF